MGPLNLIELIQFELSYLACSGRIIYLLDAL